MFFFCQSLKTNIQVTPNLLDWSCCDPYVRERIQQRQQYQLFWIFSGLRQAPNYSPLYFSALSVLAQEHSPALHTLISPLIRYAAQHLSKELMWKLYLEFAAIEERHQRLSQARLALTHSVLLCPSNLRWRVWIQGARTELSAGNIQNARRLLTRALHVVPDKVKYIVYLEIAHLEEYLGCVDRARDVLNKAKKEMQSEWKIFLESVLLEIRAQNYSRALEEVKEALQVHFQTGRLHAIHIYIVSHFKSFLPSTLNLQTNEWQILKCAIYEVPKAGEVWTEAVRTCCWTKVK
jgi:la-related protein 1